MVIVGGFLHNHGDFAAGVLAAEGVTLPADIETARPLSLATLLAGSALLFTSFVGFDSIAQAGGEAKNAHRALPIAFGLAVAVVGTFYLLFTAAVYHTVPWTFVAERAQNGDLTAAGLLGYVLPAAWTVPMVAGAAIALINDLPAMLLATSRLMFAWAEDGIFPQKVAAIHQRWHTPHVALILSGTMASAAIIGCQLAGDFFIGADILATALLVNFLLMCISMLALKRRAPELAAAARFLTRRSHQLIVGVAGAIVIPVFLFAHVMKDLQARHDRWYSHSTALWALVMLVASMIFWMEWRKLRRSGINLEERFSTLPVD